jgi:hypothetical protein
MKNNKRIQRFILIFLLISCTVCSSYGQAGLIILLLGDKVASENFHLSMDGALNVTSFEGLETGNVGFGVNFGLGTHIKLANKWHLKPEIKLMSRKKVTAITPIASVPSEIENIKTKINLNYIDIPVLLQYNISPKIFLSAGPQISFLTGGNQISSGNMSGDAESSIKIDVESFFNSVNYSFPVELGYSFLLASKKSSSKLAINAFVRYEYDFNEIFKDPQVGSAKISLFQIGLSLPFIKSPEKPA